MSSIDVVKLLTPVSAESPCGDNLEYDPRYLELERLSQGTPGQEVGEVVIPPGEPNWKELRQRCVDLLQRTRDLRVLVYLDMALLKLEGLAGLRDGLLVLKGCIEKFWEPLYPRLDPEDHNDPTERMNVLRVFASRQPGGGESVMVRMLREAPLVDSRQMGRFGLKEIALADGSAGASQAPDAPKVDKGLIQAAAKDTDPEILKGSLEAAREAAELTRAMEVAIDAKVGAGRGIDFKDVTRTLDDAAARLGGFLSLHGIASPGPTPGVAAGGTPDSSTAAMTGDVRSTSDVLSLIDRMCDFYARTEPSSPVPILLRRAQRLVGKSFWQIITDLSPSAIDSVKVISGTDEKGQVPTDEKGEAAS